MNSNKTILEKIILDSFRRHFPDFPKGRLIKSEAPDFILITSSKYSIGIELTSLPIPSYTNNSHNLHHLISDISSSIRKKEEKLDNYRKKMANSYWLIIYADSISYGENELKDNFHNLPGSHFDQVILFGLFEGKVWNLTGPPR